MQTEGGQIGKAWDGVHVELQKVPVHPRARIGGLHPVIAGALLDVLQEVFSPATSYRQNVAQLGGAAPCSSPESSMRLKTCRRGRVSAQKKRQTRTRFDSVVLASASGEGSRWSKMTR